jgi:DNA-binding MarR family transcriptional regulator
MLFMQTARAVAKHSDSRFYQASHLSTVKYVVLKALATNGGTLTHSGLAAWTDTEQHNITTFVERMKAEGLVTTERSDDDKRFIKVRLTDKGRDLFGQATPVARGVMNEVMSGISKREAAQLERLLKVLAKNARRPSEITSRQKKPAIGKKPATL